MATSSIGFGTSAPSSSVQSVACTWRFAKLVVGIDGRAFSSPAAGVRRYVHSLAGALLALPDAPSLVALGGDPRQSLPGGISRIPAPRHPPTNLGWTLVGLPLAAARARVDVLHAPAYTAPVWSPVPIVLTIHDVSYERHPEWYPYRRDWVRRAFYRRSARAASLIVTDSRFSADEIVAAYGTDEHRIRMIPLGVSGFAPAPDAPLTLPAGVTSPYLLHVGDLHERRNLAVVVDALAEARRHVGTSLGLSLVLAGQDRGLAASLVAQAASCGVGDEVICLGPVSDAGLRDLYRGAAAFVYPSLYEGFGLPVLEAMASGTPVIASRSASVPEVLGDAGLLVDPSDVRAWTDAIVAVVDDRDRCERMRDAGLRRASTFTWERTARETLHVYREALEG